MPILNFENRLFALETAKLAMPDQHDWLMKEFMNGIGTRAAAGCLDA